MYAARSLGACEKTKKKKEKTNRISERFVRVKFSKLIRTINHSV